MSRPLPLLEGQLPPSSSEVLSHVRMWVEHATNSLPWNWIDFETYSVLRAWYEDESKRGVIESIVKARIKLPTPQNHKAMTLAQFFSDAALAGMRDDLKAVADSKEPMYSEIAEKLHERGAAHAKAEDEYNVAWKWNAWTGMYGRTCGAGWLPPLKQEPEWGMWAIVPVSTEQWWTTPEDKGKDNGKE